MKVVVVELPAKAKTINKYLGGDYKVIASYGHVRDLPAKEGSVLPDADFAMSWEVDGKSEKHMKAIAQAVRGAESLILATDPDREGEAISWHVQEVLKARRALKGLDVKRVVFNEVTKNAVIEAFRRPREIDLELVEAYLARRALDYLVGFTLSPVLWRKLPGSRSAGRVQSVALRLVCEREAEIEAFKSREYWTIEATFITEGGQSFTARLTHLDGKRLDRFDLDTEDKARAAAEAILGVPGFAVAAIESRQVRRNPFPPFTTSTLQQEASRKLGFSASRTMQIAQRLYEGVDLAGETGSDETVGLITYMRTDGVAISTEAIAAARRQIGADFGAKYIPDAPRVYRSPAKNAQEAHEAIRPTDPARKPADVEAHLDRDQRRLYELIWKRTLASQMASAVLEQVTVDIADPNAKVRLRATGSVVLFDGFLALYQEDRDDAAADEEGEGARLPQMRKEERLARGEVVPLQHFTQPPPRYTEASLVKKLEELGIGRPSTYASILQVLQDRAYVRLDKRRFLPEDRGRLVTAFLTSFFERYVEYNFTADLENQLDEVSGGRVDWKELLRKFWSDFSTSVDGTKDLTIGQVLGALDEGLGRHFFPDDGSGRDPRLCPVCGAGRLSLKLGKFGAFIGCANYPNCRYTRPLAIEGDGEDAADTALGNDPASGLPVSLKKGPFGHYAQLGTADNEAKPKRVALPRSLKPLDVDLATALRLLALPRELGRHPESGETVVVGIGRFGAYIKNGAAFKSLGADDDVLTIGLNRAVVLLAEPAPERRRAPPPLRELGPHPDGGGVVLYQGRYGPYVSHDGVIASLPRGADLQTFSLEQAIPLLAARGGQTRRRGRKAGKPAAAKTAKVAKAPGRNGAAAALAPAAATKQAGAPKRTGSAKRKTAAPKSTGSAPSAGKRRRGGVQPV